MPGPVGRPLKQHQVKTVFLRVPSAVWPMLSAGRIKEFRASIGNVPQLWNVPLPSLALVYRRQRAQEYDYRLMLLEALRQEALGAITEDGLAAAGYKGGDAYARFRRDWTIHEKRRFEPLRTVVVYTVRPVQPGDYETVGSALINHLYGDYIAQEAQTRTRTISTQRRAAQAVGGHRSQLAANGARA